MSAEAFLESKGRATELALAAYLDSWRDVPAALGEAVRYSLFAGGKRLRPALALGGCEAVSGGDAPPLGLACALEMIHTYSLIHDDLPCMDDDDLRRGKPTAHKVYGEALAILAGDGLLTMAFDLLAQSGNAEVVSEVARAAGVAGMAGGQAIDLENEGKTITLDQLVDMHRRKTGALIRAACRCGAMLGGAGQSELAMLTEYGEHVGLAFQIADDILDVTGDTQTLGKTAGSDQARHKATFPGAIGVERSQAMAEEVAGRARDALRGLDQRAEPLRKLALYVVRRKA